MNTILEKLSSYNIFNYLFPGILFVLIIEKFTTYSLVQDDLAMGLFLYYFIGLIISRMGSIILEPALIKMKFLSFANYDDFIKASNLNNKIELFSEINNMYRTLCSLIMVSLLTKFYEFLTIVFPIIQNVTGEIVLILLFIIFLFSYKKQTMYIVKRIEYIIKKG